MNRLLGKIAVVVGGHDGIGGATAQRFAAEGATVYATSRRAEHGEVGHGAGTLRTRRADASDLTALAAFFDTVQSEAGRVDVLAVNAGISEFATLDGVSEGHFDRAFGLNVRSLLFATKAATAIMPDGGAVVLVGSIADAIGIKGYGVYGATKAAVRSFARTWANDLAPRNIRVNVVSPSLVLTPQSRAILAAAPDPAAALASRVAQHPLGRAGEEHEIGALVAFLASDGAAWITGQNYIADGGLSVP